MLLALAEPRRDGVPGSADSEVPQTRERIGHMLSSCTDRTGSAELVATPHRPLVIGFTAWTAFKSLAFCANGHFQS
jgi:hypothetical protein